VVQGLGILASLSVAGAAAAQAPAAPGTTEVPAVTDAPPPAPPPPDTRPSLIELQNRIDAAEQAARIAVRRVEILEEQQAAKAKEPKETPWFSAGEKGFSFRSSDGLYLLRIHGQLQIDTRWFLNDGALSDKADTFLIRRMRPSIDGTLFGLVDYKFTPDFAGGTAAVFDAYADVHPFAWLRLRAGKFKTPLGLERLQADPDLVFMERALTQDLTPQRDVGAALGGEIAGGIVTYSAGIYNGAADAANTDVDTNHAKDFVGRLLIQPFKTESLSWLGTLGLHFAASTGNRFGTPTATLLPSYKSGGQNTIFNYVTTTDPAGTPFAHLRQSRINPGLYYYIGGFGVLGEYVWDKQEVQKGNSTTTLVNQAAHATASFVINGKNGYDGATPNQVLDFSKGTWGALEIGVRWNYLKADDATFGNLTNPGLPVFAADITKSPRKAQGFGGAINYVPSRTFRLIVNFEQTRFTGGAAGAKVAATDATGAAVMVTSPANRKTENALMGRVQVNF
jgi:phosphate-selective porin OprO/OprP